MFTYVARSKGRASSKTRARGDRERLLGRRREERHLLIEQFEQRIVLDSTLHAIAAANLDVIQNDAANNTTSVTVTAPGAFNDFRVRTGSNRGDYNVQVGPDSLDDALNGMLITSVRENGRDNGAAGDTPGINFTTSAIQLTGGAYYIPVFNAPAGNEFNINIAAAWFPYSEGWLGGFAYTLAGTNGGPLDTFLGNSSLTLNTHFVDNGGGKSTVNLSEFGINSQTDGVLLVNGAKNEDNYSLSTANPDGTWTIFNKDNGSNGNSTEQDPVGFIYVPKSNNTVVSGKFLGDLSKPIESRPFTVTHLSTDTGTYRLTIPGYTPTDGVLVISAEGGASATGTNVDNIVSYKADGDGWLIQTRDLTGVGLENIAATEAVVSFVFIPAAEDAGITVAPTSGLFTTEGGISDAFAMVLDRQPSADVTINLSSSDLTEGTVSPASITFTPDNWFEVQLVTVTGVDDAVVGDSINYTVITSPAISADANYNGIDPANVTAINIDNDIIGVTVDPIGGLSTTEAGGTAVFQVILNTRPTADVTIDLSSSDPTEGALSTTSLTFTVENWGVPQLVTVTGVNDGIDDGDVAYTIITSSSSTDASYNGLAIADVAVTNSDNDTAGVVVSPVTGLLTTEAGGGAGFAVVLTSEPTANVVVHLLSSDTSEGDVASSSLTFTSADWSVPQTVTVTGQNDVVGDGDIAYTIVTTISSVDAIYAAINPADVSVTNLDNEPRIGLVATSLKYGVGESAVGIDGIATVTDPDTLDYDGGSLTVTLTTNATAFDRLEIRNVGTEAGMIGVAGSDVTYGGTVIGNFAGGQGVAPLVVSFDSDATVEAVQALLRAVTFRNVSDYPLLADRTVTFSIADGDGGTSNLASRTIEFDLLHVAQFQQNVDRGYGLYTGAADTELRQNQPDIPQPTGGDADGLLVDYDAAAANAQVLLRFSDIFGNGPGQIPLGATIVSATLTVDTNNPGDGGTFQRMLLPWDAQNDTWNSFGNSLGGRNLTPGIQLDGVEARARAVDDTSQVGTPDGTGSTGTGITNMGVTADLQAWSNGEANLGWVMTGWNLRTDGWAFSPSEASNPADRPLLSVQWIPTTTGVASFRNDDMGNYLGTTDTMLLQLAPSDDQSGNPLIYVDAADASNESQILLQFQDIIGDGASQIPAGALVHAAVLTVASTIPDAMGHGGQFVTMLQPWYDQFTNWSGFTNGVQANGVEASSSSNTQAGNASRTPLVQATFNSFDVTADVQAWVSGTLANNGWAILPWAGGTDGWGFASSDSIENERPQLRVYYTPAGITVTPTTDLVTTESGETAHFSVVLNTPPTANVTIGLASSDTAEGTVSVEELTFTSENWNVPQTVTVTGVDDLIPEATDHEYFIYIDPAVSSDPAYSGLDADDISVTNVDDDSPGVLVQPTSGLTTTEQGGTATFTVKLNSEPAGDVTISLISDDTTEGTVSPASLTFTAANWFTRQTVTVTGVDDHIIDGDRAFNILTTASSVVDAFYNVVVVDDVPITNADDDVAGVTITPTSGLVTTEAGGTATFTVVLDTQPQPSKSVKIDLSSSDTTEGTVSPLNLTFTDGNWNTPQTVTITGVNDTDDDNDIAYSIVTAAISQFGSGLDPDYGGLNPADVLVINVDNENAVPIVTLPGGTVFYGIGTDGVGIDSRATVVDTDPGDLATGTLTVTLVGGTADDRLTIRNDGTATGQVGLSGSNVTYGGIIIGTLAGGAGTAPLVVTFNSAATPGIAQAVLRVVTFNNVSATPDTTPRTLQVAVTDGDGGTSNTASKTIQLGLKRITAFQEGVDWGYGAYAGTADIQLRQATPDTPPAAIAGLLVDYDAGTVNSQVLLRYDDLIGNGPGQIPVGAQIISARLVVNTNSLDTNSPGDGATLHRLLTNWDAETETWNTFGNGVAPRNATAGVQPDDAEARIVFDSQVSTASSAGTTGTGSISIGVTPDVQAWADGDANHGWAMIGWFGNTDGWIFRPSEATNPADRPALYVEWIPADAQSLSFRQGVNGYSGAVDTRLLQSAADTHYSKSTPIWSDASDAAPATNESQILLRFEDIIGNGLSQIPVGAQIHAAVLTLASVDADAMGDGGKFHTMQIPWSDTDTWNTLGGGVSADDSEASSTHNTSAGFAALNPDVQGGFNPFDVTVDVQAWVNGTRNNNGWAILPWVGGNNGWGVASSEAVLEKYRPELRVYFTAGPGVTIDPISNLTATESGATDELSVVLNTQPIADVTITVTADSQTVVSSDGGSTFSANAALTFTSVNWNALQNIVVRAIDDSVVEGNHAGKVSFAATSADPDYNGAAINDLTIALVDNDMALVEQVVVNDGSAQRSMVTEVRVTFNAEVSIAASAFQIINRDTNQIVPMLSTLDSSRMIATITFLNGDSVETRPIGNSLADGNYQLTIDATKITVNGMQLDGDRDGSAGGNHVFGDVAADDFFRLFGDGDGEAGVDFGDLYGGFLPSYGSEAADPGYVEAFDWDGEAGIDFGDLYEHMLINYGKERDLSGY